MRMNRGRLNLVGLDPNYLTVDPQAEHNRLHKNDAHFVSVIHTQGGKLHEVLKFALDGKLTCSAELNLSGVHLVLKAFG